MSLLEVAELTVKWKHYRDGYRRLFETTDELDKYNAKIADWQEFIKECKEKSKLELIPLITKLADRASQTDAHLAIIILAAGYELASGNDLTIK